VTADELLKVYDSEVRGSFPERLPHGWVGEEDGPLWRGLTNHDGFTMLTADAAALTNAELVTVVDRTFAYFTDRKRRFEWKTFDHDRADLLPLLEARGAEPEEHETLLMGNASVLAAEPRLPDGLVMRRVTARSDLERIAALSSEVWGEDWSWLSDDLEARLDGADPIVVLLVEDGDLAVSAAWLVPLSGTRVAGLWGGNTLSAYRGRGIYRALVARRAQIALETGYSILQVDASDDSRPILVRLGLHVVGGTTPYVTSSR
jgi:GNAT superfamily N-acetyltransferase